MRTVLGKDDSAAGAATVSYDDDADDKLSINMRLAGRK